MRPGLLLAMALLGVGAADAAPVVSDLRDYALAECLTKQTASPALRDEGYRLGEIVVFRAHIMPGHWRMLTRAVDAEFAARPMLTTHVDAPVGQSDRPVPLAHCLAIIDSPRVRAAASATARGR